MSLVSSIRDYVEFLNTLSNSLGSEFTSSKFIIETCSYFLKTIQYSLYYIVSLQWLRDFTLLPITIPQISHSIFSENLFLQTKDPGKVFFQFLEIPSIEQNKFILGFFNSFFLTLPITLTHIISFRRLLIQGIPAAVFSFLGFILGQTFFILCIVFGIRSILIPWLSLEPFNYIFGLFLIFKIVYAMIGEKLTPLKWNDYSHHRNFFIINFLLAWCEQSCIFQYFSNITLSEYPSLIEGFSTKTTLADFLSHSLYIFGIVIGSILFSLLWSFVIIQIRNIIVRFTTISLSGFVQTVNKGTFIVVLGLALSSIPFYGFDYLFTGPFGFISGDSSLKNTIFSENSLKDPFSMLFNSKADDQKLNIDIAPFDRGAYMEQFSPSLYTFEDLNYRGELDWLNRTEKESGESKAGFLSLSKIFKKQNENQSGAKSQFKTSQVNNYKEYNSLLFEQSPEIKQDVSDIDARFSSWYDFKKDQTTSGELKKDSPMKENFQEFNLANYPLDFASNEPQVSMGKIIKQKYYSNPLYKNLLALDIDLFLNRQPDSSFLTKYQEIDLYSKRQMLDSYCNSLRFYQKLPYEETFEEFFDGTKSFSNKIYNQQFKGTLENIQRLFSLEIKSEKDNFDFEVQDLVKTTLEFPLKYDQPLYVNGINFSPYHEEIPVSGFDETNKTKSNPLKKFILQDMISKPLYAGWDENLRKFVITNKFLPQRTAGYEIKIPLEWYKKFKVEKQSKKQQVSKGDFLRAQKINFTEWPRPIQFFAKAEVPFSSLFSENIGPIISLIDQEYSALEVDDQEYLLKNNYTSLPSNIKNVERIYRSQKKLQTPEGSKTEVTIAPLMPERGGFVWPGNFSFDFKKFLK